MAKFVSMNFTVIECKECGEKTTIEPGREFKQLNCKCNTEVSKQLKEIKVATNKGDGTEVEVIGEFKNGDLEIKRVDSNLSYRITLADFDTHFEYVEEQEGQDLKPTLIPLTLESLVDKSAEDIKAAYTVDELRTLARDLKIRGASQMNEDNLVNSLLEKCKS